jgi:hypothetical protein
MKACRRVSGKAAENWAGGCEAAGASDFVERLLAARCPNSAWVFALLTLCLPGRVLPASSWLTGWLGCLWCRTWPTRRSPVLVKATTEGVVRPPSALGMMVGLPPSMAAQGRGRGGVEHGQAAGAGIRGGQLVPEQPGGGCGGGGWRRQPGLGPARTERTRSSPAAHELVVPRSMPMTCGTGRVGECEVPSASSQTLHPPRQRRCFPPTQHGPLVRYSSPRETAGGAAAAHKLTFSARQIRRPLRPAGAALNVRAVTGVPLSRERPSLVPVRALLCCMAAAGAIVGWVSNKVKVNGQRHSSAEKDDGPVAPHSLHCSSSSTEVHTQSVGAQKPPTPHCAPLVPLVCPQLDCQLHSAALCAGKGGSGQAAGAASRRRQGSGGVTARGSVGKRELGSQKEQKAHRYTATAAGAEQASNTQNKQCKKVTISA